MSEVHHERPTRHFWIPEWRTVFQFFLFFTFFNWYGILRILPYVPWKPAIKYYYYYYKMNAKFEILNPAYRLCDAFYITGSVCLISESRSHIISIAKLFLPALPSCLWVTHILHDSLFCMFFSMSLGIVVACVCLYVQTTVPPSVCQQVCMRNNTLPIPASMWLWLRYVLFCGAIDFDHQSQI